MNDHTPRYERAFILDSLERTGQLGELLARSIDSPGTLALFGGLGSGKTTLVQAVGRALGVSGPVTSPTYTIINRYEDGRLPLVHVDCYRLNSVEELEGIGLPEVLAGDEVVCMEWSERADGLLPPRRLELELGWLEGERRNAALRAYGGLWPRIQPELEAWLERSGIR